MKSESLAVKYRPRTLEGLIGQDHIQNQIRGMFKAKRVNPTMMLFGPTGLGKTTTARLLAQMLNCEDLNKKTLQPCGKCRNCQYKPENHPDVHEINMANETGVDNARTMIKQASGMPTMGNFRIFILDEFHKATSAAQEAFLKPLEDPPKHTIWIIASMTPDKVKDAIAGRCLLLQVKRIEPETLVKHLGRIAKKEGVDFSEVKGGKEILKTIADYSNGGLRNAIQLLDGVLLAYASGNKIDAKTVLAQLRSTGDAELDALAAQLLVHLHKADLKELITLVRKLEETGVRGVMYKTRYLIDFYLDQLAGTTKFTPYSAKCFASLAKEAGIKPKLPLLVDLQYLLLDVETRLNSLNVDERTVFGSMLGNFVLANSKKG